MSAIWFPYQQMKSLGDVPEVVSGKGVYLNFSDGQKAIDAVSSWWCVIHGYAHQDLNRALTTQAEKMSHVMLGGLTHAPAETLAEKLVSITPEGLNHVFFGDSGSVGVEIAIKMAVQYWKNKGKGDKSGLLALKRAYHGDTCGVMSIGDPDDGMHALFSGLLPVQHFVEAPSMGYDADEVQLHLDLSTLEDMLEKNHDRLAAFVVEPLMQGAGGFNFYSPRYLASARALCDRFDILFIFDEVATGFGRTGTMFAADQAYVCPDIMVLGKGLTAGYLGMSATLATTKVYEAFLDDRESKAFMHGPTFMGNPLACAVALESLNVFNRDHYLDRIKAIESEMKQSLAGFEHVDIRDCRVLGATAVIEVKEASVLKGFQDYALKRGVWLRPFDRYLYTMPPYIITPSELALVLNVMKDWFSRRDV
ncbi:MAG: adenosylmethionine-8-amino-7-oxononanoate aminotransferase [Candidatus Marinamargulisbacteria bacterium]|jgi:adenosylmethionine-8-amino-7-oxononanoate aminotransferase